jgi:hypothetical protein
VSVTVFAAKGHGRHSPSHDRSDQDRRTTNNS